MDILQNIPVWFPLVVASSLFLGIYDLCKKHAVQNNAVLPVLFLATACGSIVFVAATFLRGGIAEVAFCGWKVWGLLLVKSVIVASSWTFVYYSMRDLPISIASPFRASSPLWTLLGAMIVFGEIPSGIQFCAMAVMFAGCFMFSWVGGQEGFSWKSKSMLLLFAGTLLGSASALYDRFLLGRMAIDHNIVQFHFSVDLVMVLGIALLFNLLRSGSSRKFQWRWTIPATGILVVISDWFYFWAVSQPDVQIAILSLIRRSNCVFTFILGVMIFRDKNIKRKAVAMCLVLIGAVVLALVK